MEHVLYKHLDVLFAMCKVAVFLDAFVLMLASSAKFCYLGMNANSMEALLNQSCVTNKTHVAESLLATEYRPESDNGFLDTKQRAKSLDLANHGGEGHDCYIFWYVSTEYLSADVKKESVHSKFGCDFQNVCKGKRNNKDIDNVVLHGETGQVYCCQENNCNTITKMPHPPANNQICFNGQSNASNVIYESCGHPDSFCITRTIITGSGTVEMYSCDNHKACNKEEQHGAYNFCHQNGTGDNIERLCCCVDNKCNKPTDRGLIPRPHHRNNNGGKGDKSSYPFPNSTNSWRKIVNPIANPASSKNRDQPVIKGLVVTIIVVALVGILVLIVLAYRKRQRQSGGAVRNDPNIIMQYERLSYSDVSLEGSVSV